MLDKLFKLTQSSWSLFHKIWGTDANISKHNSKLTSSTNLTCINLGFLNTVRVTWLNIKSFKFCTGIFLTWFICQLKKIIYSYFLQFHLYSLHRKVEMQEICKYNFVTLQLALWVCKICKTLRLRKIVLIMDWTQNHQLTQYWCT